jgi:hypothetical protein
MKLFFLFISQFVIMSLCEAQKIKEKKLFFYQDSIPSEGCGTIITVSILYFTSDTTQPLSKKTGYFIAIPCVDSYEDSFFQKGKEYILSLNKDYSKIKPYMSKTVFEHYYVTNKLYTLANRTIPRVVR